MVLFDVIFYCGGGGVLLVVVLCCMFSCVLVVSLGRHKISRTLTGHFWARPWARPWAGSNHYSLVRPFSGKASKNSYHSKPHHLHTLSKI